MPKIILLKEKNSQQGDIMDGMEADSHRRISSIWANHQMDGLSIITVPPRV